MASYQKGGGMYPVREQLDLNPTQGKSLAVFAGLVCERFRGARRASSILGVSVTAVSNAKLAGRDLRQPVLVVDALAEYAGCSREDLLAGRAVLPAAEAA